MSPLKNEEKEREINILTLISYLGLAMMFLLFLSSTPTEIDLKYGGKINEVGADSTQVFKKIWLQLYIVGISLPFGIYSLLVTRFSLWYFPRIK